jgi:hypothetical protein
LFGASIDFDGRVKSIVRTKSGAATGNVQQQQMMNAVIVDPTDFANRCQMSTLPFRWEKSLRLT